MPTNSPDQQITTPNGPDPAVAPQDFLDFLADVETRLVKRYTNEADRTARNPAPPDGEVSFLADIDRWDRRQGAAWWEMFPLFARKLTETQVVNNSTALVPDSHLLLPVQINGVYEVTGLAVWDSGTTADIKFSWTGPAGATMPRWTVMSTDTGVATQVGNYNSAPAAALGSTLARNGAGIGTFVAGLIKGLLVVAGTAGTLTLTWAQNALEVVNTRIKTDSYLRLDRVG